MSPGGKRASGRIVPVRKPFPSGSRAMIPTFAFRAASKVSSIHSWRNKLKGICKTSGDAAAVERLSEDLFAVAPSVHVCRVEEVHTQVDRVADRSDRFCVVRGTVRVPVGVAPDRPGAEPDFGDLQPCATERPGLHRRCERSGVVRTFRSGTPDPAQSTQTHFRPTAYKLGKEVLRRRRDRLGARPPLHLNFPRESLLGGFRSPIL